ncbi:hypothetical protein ACS0TY_033952 [Phlomoides rotata]
MDRNAFGRLCILLRNMGSLGDGKHVSVEEQVAMPEPVPSDSTNPRWKWFKGCLGAIDGTYISSASDARVLRDSISRVHSLKVPVGNYYLCDNGYANSADFLSRLISIN